MIRSGLKCHVASFASAVLLSACATLASAEAQNGPRGGDDTILVEFSGKEFYGDASSMPKMSYSSMVKRVASNLIGIDLESTTSFGQNKKTSIIKSFKDITERSQYRVDVDNDEIELKFSLNL